MVKKKQNNKKYWMIGLVVAVIAVVVAAVVAVVVNKQPEPVNAMITDANVMNKYINTLKDGRYEEARTAIVEGNDINGGIADHVLGNKDADLLVIEYVDFNVKASVENDAYVRAMLQAYGDKVALVRRTMNWEKISPASRAVEAAGLQGLYNEFWDVAVKNWDEWGEASVAKQVEQMDKYMKQIGGDVEQFQKDMRSQKVLEKMAFDKGTLYGEKIWMEDYYAPVVLINGEQVPAVAIREKVVDIL